MPGRKRDTDGQLQERTRLKKPRKFKVLIHNDDYTTMEFVVFVLQAVFHLSPAAASRIMLNIHKTGIGIAGVYSRDVADTRVEQVLSLAREAGHPLQCTMEPE